MGGPGCAAIHDPACQEISGATRLAHWSESVPPRIIDLENFSVSNTLSLHTGQVRSGSGKRMQHVRMTAALWALAAMISAAAAQGGSRAALPDTMPCPDRIAALATCYTAKLETGAYVTAAMPKNWNGDLVVFAHGGPSLLPPTPTSGRSDLAKYAYAVERGYAWAASSYRREGYGVAMAVADSDDARKFFIARFGKPRRIVLHGASYGGLVGAKLVETIARNPDGGLNFDGAFLNSGAVTGATLNYQHRVDLRAVYQYYCRNMPRPDEASYPLWNGVAPDSAITLKDLEAVVDECTGVSHPAAARSERQKQNLANILGVMGYPENLLVRHMQAGTLLFRDIVKNTTGGRNPFSNTGVQYKGSSNDAALNREVVRFEADPAAAAALKADGDLTGVLPVPVVSIHSVNDPQVVVEAQSAYLDTVTNAGSSERLVQAFTDERGHTAQSAPELAAALDALMQWIDKNVKPTAQSIAQGCEQIRASFDGPCRYHPDYAPKPYATRYYARDGAVR